REQANIPNLIPRIPELFAAFKATVKTDIPQGDMAKLAGLAGSVDTKNIRSYVFSFPRYGTQTGPGAPVYKYLPNVNKIRAAVATADQLTFGRRFRRDSPSESFHGRARSTMP